MTTTLEQLDRQLAELAAPDKQVLEQLDAFFAHAGSEQSPELASFFTARYRRILDELSNPPTDGISIWKLYSSGILLHLPDGTVIGFDVNDGCGALRMPPEQEEAFAQKIDWMFYTHEHPDHVGASLAKALLRHHKRVVAPRNAIRLWQLDGADAAEDCDMDAIHCYASFQRIAGTEDVVNFAYILRAAGVSFLVRGDVYDGSDFTRLLNQIEADGQRVDVAFISPFSLTPPDPVAELHERFHCRFIPLHEWEFSHRPAGKSGAATQSYGELFRLFDQPIRDGKCAVMTWGDRLDLPCAKSSNQQRF